MKKVITTIIVLFSIVTFGNAQTASGGFRRAGTNAQIKAMQKQKLKDSLGISEGQAKSVDAIQQDYMLRIRAVKMNSQITEEERKSQLSAIQDERKEKLREVLNEQQLAHLDGQKKYTKKATHNSNKKKSAGYKKSKKAVAKNQD